MRAPKDDSLRIILKALEHTALETGLLYVGFYEETLPTVNALRAAEGYGPITASGLRQYIEQVTAEETGFTRQGLHGPLALKLDAARLDALVAHQIHQAEVVDHEDGADSD